MKRIKTRLNTVIGAISALVAVLAAAPAQALPLEFSARYAATAHDMTVGRAELHLERDGNQYRYSSKIRATGLVGLFYDGRIVEASTGTLTEHGLRPARYDYQRTGKGEREDNIRFAVDGRDALLHYKGDTRETPLPADALDPLSLHIALMNDVAAGKQRMRYLVAEPRRVQVYEVAVTGRERITTASGKFDAVRVDLVGRRDVTPDESFSLAKIDVPAISDGKQTSFWLAPELDYLVVRIRHRDPDDGVVGIDLQNVETLRGSEVAS